MLLGLLDLEICPDPHTKLAGPPGALFYGHGRSFQCLLGAHMRTCLGRSGTEGHLTGGVEQLGLGGVGGFLTTEGAGAAVGTDLP